MWACHLHGLSERLISDHDHDFLPGSCEEGGEEEDSDQAYLLWRVRDFVLIMDITILKCLPGEDTIFKKYDKSAPDPHPSMSHPISQVCFYPYLYL